MLRMYPYRAALGAASVWVAGAKEVHMRTTIFDRAGRRFVSLSDEGWDGTTAAEQTERIFLRMEKELKGMGLSLDDSVRTRLWARDRESRAEASTQRVKMLSGMRRCASSSYISPTHLASNALTAVDHLVLLREPSDQKKVLREYSPPIVPLRYNISGGLVFLSGVTSEVGTLEEQIAKITDSISSSLTDAGSAWNKVVTASFFLHRSKRVEDLERAFTRLVSVKLPDMQFGFADGYSTEGKLLEVEVTAAL
jgi:enamine deaminase RidA (YjgF/YER057c/UK114 family)